MEAKVQRCSVGLIETSAALGACLLVLTVAVVIDRRPYRPGKPNYISDDDHRPRRELSPRLASPNFDGLQLIMSSV